ncbi:MAG TPA: hypothetical protein VF461_23490, partial [Gemmatimonadaceae bacterium]
IAILPAVIGMFTVAGLAYWGQYAHQAPQLVIVLAIVAAVLSFIVAWSNARSVARRIERLAGATAHARTRVAGAGANGGAPDQTPLEADEIDEIHHTVEGLRRAVDVAESDRATTQRREDQRARDHAELLLSIVDGATNRLDEVRLPLHILLDNHFGDLNENQEEMLGSARAATEAIDTELVSLRRIAELDLGTTQPRIERVRTSDVVEPILPLLVSAAESAGASLRTEIAPLLPAIAVDRTQLQEALTTLLRSRIAAAAHGTDLDLRAGLSDETRTPGQVEIVLTGAPASPASVHTTLARRLIQVNGGDLREEEARLRVMLPVSTVPGTVR